MKKEYMFYQDSGKYGCTECKKVFDTKNKVIAYKCSEKNCAYAICPFCYNLLLERSIIKESNNSCKSRSNRTTK